MDENEASRAAGPSADRLLLGEQRGRPGWSAGIGDDRTDRIETARRLGRRAQRPGRVGSRAIAPIPGSVAIRTALRPPGSGPKPDSPKTLACPPPCPEGP